MVMEGEIMKAFPVLLLIPATIFGLMLEDGCREVLVEEYMEPQDSDGIINLTVLNTFTCPYSSQILDLACDPWGSTIGVAFSSEIDNKIYWCDSDDGTYVWEANLHSNNGFCFGITLLESIAFTNDSITTDLYVTDDFVNWNISSNPAGNLGRGLKYSTGGYCWETNDMNIIRFVPYGSSMFFSTPEISSRLSGLTIFNIGSDIYIALTCFTTHSFYFYEYDGSSITIIESVPCPATCEISYGIDYDIIRGNLFWSYKNSGVYYISELDVEIDIGLEESTWGSIKTILH